MPFEIDVTESELYQLGREDGIQRGEERGITKGITKGGASILARFLERRFGALPLSVKDRLEQADHAQL
jgi:hypothetical protein